MRVVATILVGLLLLLGESLYVEIFKVSNLIPHVSTGLAVYLALDKEFVEGAAEIVILAWIADLFYAGPPGVLAMALTLSFLLVRGAAMRLSLRSRPVRLILSMVMAVLVQVLSVGIIIVVGRDTSLIEPMIYGGMPSALLAPIGLVVVHLTLGRVDALLKPRSRGLLRE